MDLSNSDLEGYVKKLENIFSNEKSLKKQRQELSLLVENISDDLKASKQSEDALRDEFNKLIDSTDFNSTQKYVEIEEKCVKQQNEIQSLKTELEELKNRTSLDLDRNKNEYLSRIRDTEEKLGSQIIFLKNELDAQRTHYETKERELYNEMQMMQAATALEWDEKESIFKKQLADSSTNLRISQSKIRSMQCEINRLKSQISMLQCSPVNNPTYLPETPIQQIKNNITQKKLFEIDTNLELKDAYTKEVEPDRPESCDTVSTIKINRSLDDTDLNVSTVEPKESPSEALKTATVPFEKMYAPVVYKGSNRSKNRLPPPPLKPTSTNNSKNDYGFSNVTKKETQRKRRKLYDPDNVDYLSR